MASHVKSVSIKTSISLSYGLNSSVQTGVLTISNISELQPIASIVPLIGMIVTATISLLKNKLEKS